MVHVFLNRNGRSVRYNDPQFLRFYLAPQKEPAGGAASAVFDILRAEKRAARACARALSRGGAGGPLAGKCSKEVLDMPP